MRISFKEILKETLNQMSYSNEETEKYRIILATLIDTTLSKPTLDVNTFLDPVEQEDQYKWFRYNPEEYIETYSDVGGTYGPVRDPKETTLLYYLYRGTFKGQDGKWYIGTGENTDAVIKEVRARASAFVDAIGDYQELIDIFYSDFQKVLEFTDKFSEKSEKATAVSSFMSKGSPGEFERMEFAKFRSGALYGDTTTKGIRGTRDHMYKHSPELKNIPEDHKYFFSFDYMWMTCYNLAQEDGLKPSGKNVMKLTGQYYADNYRNGITIDENKKMFGTGGWTANLDSTQGLSFLSNMFLSSILNDEKSILKDEDGENIKPVSQMSEDEIVNYLQQPFNDILNKAKQALNLNVYPSTMIDLLRIKNKIPKVLIDNKKRQFARTIKGLQLAGYLDENEEFTNMVKQYEPKKFIVNNLKNFESLVISIGKKIKTGKIIDQNEITKIKELTKKLTLKELDKAKQIMIDNNVNNNTIKSVTVNYTENVTEASVLLRQIALAKDSETETGNKTNVSYKKDKLKSIMDNSTDEEVQDIVKIIKHYKRGS